MKGDMLENNVYWTTMRMENLFMLDNMNLS